MLAFASSSNPRSPLKQGQATFCCYCCCRALDLRLNQIIEGGGLLKQQITTKMAETDLIMSSPLTRSVSVLVSVLDHCRNPNSGCVTVSRCGVDPLFMKRK